MRQLIVYILSGVAAVLPWSAVGAEWMDWTPAAEIEIGSDDNINIAPEDFEESDAHLALRAGLSRGLVLGGAEYSNARLVFSGEAGRRHYHDWRDLTRNHIGAAMSYQHKLGLGITAPRLNATIAGRYEDVRHDDRDATYYTVDLGLDKRVGPRLDLGASLVYRLRDGNDWQGVDPLISSQVYDSEHAELHLEARYTALPRVRLSLRASYFDGEFDSDCANLFSPGGGIYGEGGGLGGLRDGPVWRSFGLKGLARDPVFECRWLADGDGLGLRTSVEVALSPRGRLRIEAGYRDIELDLGQDYSNTVFSLAYRQSF